MTRIITIGREIGSGGRTIGRKLAEKLGIAYYDQEVISEIAKSTAQSQLYVKNVMASRLESLFPIHIMTSFADPNEELNQTIFAAQRDVMREMALMSDCVIVGRCADHVLKDLNPFRVFIYADEESKIARSRAAGYTKGTDKELKAELNKIDKNKAKFYNFYTGQKWGAMENYDVCINATGKELDDIAEGLAKLFR